MRRDLTSTFDLQGVYANLTISLGLAFDSNGIKIYGSIYAVAVMILWACIAVRSLLSLKEIIRGDGGCVADNVEDGPQIVPSRKG